MKRVKGKIEERKQRGARGRDKEREREGDGEEGEEKEGGREERACHRQRKERGEGERTCTWMTVKYKMEKEKKDGAHGAHLQLARLQATSPRAASTPRLLTTPQAAASVGTPT